MYPVEKECRELGKKRGMTVRIVGGGKYVSVSYITLTPWRKNTIKFDSWEGALEFIQNFKM